MNKNILRGGITLALAATLTGVQAPSMATQATAKGPQATAATLTPAQKKAQAAAKAKARAQASARAKAVARARMVKQKRLNVVTTAASKKGLKYRYGGTSPTRGFDCSGFTQWVFKKHGVNLPRTTRQQVRKGVVIKHRAHAQPGDLIFTNGGGHVGIVADKGAKTMWHSPRTGRSISKDPVKHYKITKIVRVVY